MKSLLRILVITGLLACTARAQIVTINATDILANSRTTLNNNFAWLNSYKTGKFTGSGAPGTIALTTLGDQYYDTMNQVVYVCFRVLGCTTVASGNWVLGTGGSTFTAITSGTNTSATMTVGSGSSLVRTGTGIIDANKILNTVLTTLTGPIKMTAGIPSVAVSADIIGLFTSCSGTQYLGADGACHSAAGGSALPFATTATTGTLSIANGTPAVYGCNGVSTSIANGTTTVVRLAGTASETLLIGISCADNHLKLIAPTNTFTCTVSGFSGCDTVTGSAFTDGIIPLASDALAAGGGSWTFSTTPTDLRAPIQDDPLTAGAGILVTKSTATRTVAIDTSSVPRKFFGTTTPGSISGNLPGDLYTDTTGHNEYYCGAPAATAAPACTTVSVGGWTLAGGTTIDPTVIQYISVHLTSAQIKALVASPVTLIAAPGANKVIELQSVTIIYNFLTTAYTAGATTFIAYGNGQGAQGALSSGFTAAQTFTPASSHINTQPVQAQLEQALANAVNQPIVTINSATEFATGDGDAWVHLTYRIVPTNG